jgi:N-acyl-L-homoserine lactone synthetase
MIFVVDAANRRHFGADLAAMYCHRKAVFVDRARWSLPVIADQEIDSYDLLEDTVYLLNKDEPEGPVLASVRLLATTGPHLMRELYSATARSSLPSGPTVREASRYCTAPGVRGRSKRLRLLWEIICGIMETGLERGIGTLIFAANRSLLPLALQCGWAAKTVGPTMSDGNDEVTAVVAEVTLDGLRAVRNRHGLAESSVRTETTSDAFLTSERPGICDGSGLFPQKS